ncbi:MAG: UDP-N-acetylmuramate dehydrogenase [Candidatus Zixiibacteriota bacterium]|nr:MAG: UDP-N-acetylmuramate dehydrogenase [candidate division Zixibacteria bacterium]
MVITAFQHPFSLCFESIFSYIVVIEMVEQLSVMRNIPKADLVEALGPNLETERELAPLTSYGTGGPAAYFIVAETADEIVRAVTGAKRLGIPFFLIGGGSNLLVSDSGFDGLIIRVGVKGLKLIGSTEIEAGAGEDLQSLVEFAATNSLTGLEFAAGIWGSVGGAICGNAGAFGGEIGQIVRELTLITGQGDTRTVGPDYCEFDYRHSILKESAEIIISARFGLQPGNADAISKRIEEILTLRKERHPVDQKSAGCVFRNIPDATQPHGKLAAGKLLDEAGVKGLSVGDATVSRKHANIIVNTGNATSKDIRQLADIMKQRVLEKFGLELREEVVQVGEF